MAIRRLLAAAVAALLVAGCDAGVSPGDRGVVELKRTHGDPSGYLVAEVLEPPRGDEVRVEVLSIHTPPGIGQDGLRVWPGAESDVPIDLLHTGGAGEKLRERIEAQWQ